MPKLTTLVCYVTSVEHSVAFYMDLGFEVDRPRRDYASVSLGQLALQLHEEGTESIPEFRESAAIRPRGGSLYFYFPVPDIDGWFRNHANATSYEEPRNRPWGKREVLVADPDGFLLMFYEGDEAAAG